MRKGPFKRHSFSVVNNETFHKSSPNESFKNVNVGLLYISNLFPTMSSTGIPGKNGISSKPGGAPLIVPANLLTTVTKFPRSVGACETMKFKTNPLLVCKDEAF